MHWLLRGLPRVQQILLEKYNLLSLCVLYVLCLLCVLGVLDVLVCTPEKHRADRQHQIERACRVPNCEGVLVQTSTTSTIVILCSR